MGKARPGCQWDGSALLQEVVEMQSRAKLLLRRSLWELCRWLGIGAAVGSGEGDCQAGVCYYGCLGGVTLTDSYRLGVPRVHFQGGDGAGR